MQARLPSAKTLERAFPGKGRALRRILEATREELLELECVRRMPWEKPCPWCGDGTGAETERADCQVCGGDGLVCGGEDWQAVVYRALPKLPPMRDLVALVRAVKKDIGDEYRADPEDDMPGIQLTVGALPSGEWTYQTGDNCYTGGAYGYPHWAVVSVHRRSNARDLARDIRSQLAELFEADR